MIRVVNKHLYLLIPAILAGFSTAQAGNFQMDPDASVLAVDAKASPPHTFTSEAKQFDCDITIDPASLEVTSATCSFAFADLDSGKPKRDKKMRDWMDIEAHPVARFELSDVRMEDGQSIAAGKFTMHGTSREIEVPFTVQRDGDRIVLDGHSEFSYEDWDLKIIRMFIFSVNPDLKPRFHLEGTLSNGNE